MADDGKIGIITEYLLDKKRTCATEIWYEALKETNRPKKWETSEINNIISKLPDWEKIKSPTKFGNYGNQRGFQKIVLKDNLQTDLQCSKECSQIIINEDNSFKEFNEKTPFN